jgi:hypothetical protein
MYYKKFIYNGSRIFFASSDMTAVLACIGKNRYNNCFSGTTDFLKILNNASPLR